MKWKKVRVDNNNTVYITKNVYSINTKIWMNIVY